MLLLLQQFSAALSPSLSVRNALALPGWSLLLVIKGAVSMETAGLARPDVEHGGPSPLAPWRAVADLLGGGGRCERRHGCQGHAPPFPPPASPLSSTSSDPVGWGVGGLSVIRLSSTCNDLARNCFNSTQTDGRTGGQTGKGGAGGSDSAVAGGEPAGCCSRLGSRRRG